MKSMSGVRKNEQGVVSILVTMIMILVISLIVLGFAQISRRNQREALDNQLSTQAYYAAESGVNAAVNYLTSPSFTFGTTINTIGQCNTFINSYLKPADGATVNTLDSGSGAQYNCLMVDNEPSSLVVSPVTQNSNIILHLQNPESQNFNALKFVWTQQATPDYPAGACTGSNALGPNPNGYTMPTYDKWNCPYGIMRLDLVDADATSGRISNINLDNDTYQTSFYLVPNFQTGGVFKTQVNVSWPQAVQAVNPASPTVVCNTAAPNGNNCPVQVIPVSCQAAATPGSRDCSMELDFPGADTGANGSKELFARLSTLYQDSQTLTITGGDHTYPLPGGTKFIGGQALIDSTGKSQDELRRIQVRIPLSASSGSLPAYGLQSTGSICKQLTYISGANAVDNCVPPHP